MAIRPQMMNPKMEAINRQMAGQGGATRPGVGNMAGGPPNAQPGAPGGQPGAGQSPIEVALKILDLIVQRLGEMNPQAAQKLGAAVEGLKASIEEVKKELSASGGKPPVAGQLAGATPPPAAVPSGPRQPMPA